MKKPNIQWPKIPSQWPAFLFSLALLFSSFLAVFSQTKLSEYLCQTGEGIAVCSRNWLNAVGNIIAALIAFAAALFAYNQYVVGDRQAALGTLPYIEKRISDLKRVSVLVGNAIRAQVSLQGTIWNFFILLNENPPETILRERALPISGLRASLEEARRGLLEASGDLLLSAQMRELADEQARYCEIADHDKRQMLQYVVRFAERKTSIASTEITLAADHADRARPAMREDLRKLQATAVSLVDRVNEAQEERDHVLSGRSN